MVTHVLLSRPDLSGPDRTEILLLRRAGTGFMDGYFSLPGGHLEAGELPMEAAQRECREEVGVNPVGLAPVCVLPYASARRALTDSASERSYPVQKGLNLVFGAKSWDGVPCINEPHCADVLVWAPMRLLPVPVVPWLATVLDMADAGHWYQELEYS